MSQFRDIEDTPSMRGNGGTETTNIDANQLDTSNTSGLDTVDEVIDDIEQALLRDSNLDLIANLSIRTIDTSTGSSRNFSDPANCDSAASGSNRNLCDGEGKLIRSGSDSSVQKQQQPPLSALRESSYRPVNTSQKMKKQKKDAVENAEGPKLKKHSSSKRLQSTSQRELSFTRKSLPDSTTSEAQQQERQPTLRRSSHSRREELPVATPIAFARDEDDKRKERETKEAEKKKLISFAQEDSYDDISQDSAPTASSSSQGSLEQEKKRRFSLKRRNTKSKSDKDKRKSRLTVTSALWDLDGDGVLDEAEQAMRDADKDNSGTLSNEEIHQIVLAQLSAKKNAHFYRKVVAGLLVFVFILALSNLGTSFASVILAKESVADSESSTMRMKGTNEIIGSQSVAENFSVEELSEDVRRRRRQLVWKEMEEDPFGHHAHLRRLDRTNKDGTRRLGKKNNKCKSGRLSCDDSPEDILYDTGYMTHEEVKKLLKKCNGGNVVNLVRKWPDGTKEVNNICKAGVEVLTKDKKSNKDKDVKKKEKGKTKKKEDDLNDMIISFDNGGQGVNLDCDATHCYTSGTALLQRPGEPCSPNNYNSDCQDGLICVGTRSWDTTGICTRVQRPRLWYVHWEDHTCVQDCDARTGRNCGGDAQYEDELFIDSRTCCGLMLSWKPYRDCVRDYLDAQDEANMYLVIGGDGYRPLFQDTKRCSAAGGSCFSRADEFSCCSGQCRNGMCV